MAKILKGSKDKKLLKLELDENPSYGFFCALEWIKWLWIHKLGISELYHAMKSVVQKVKLLSKHEWRFSLPFADDIPQELHRFPV